MSANPGIRAAELKLESEKQESETTLRASGRISSDTSATLEKTLRELIPGSKRVVLDLTNVSFIDSSGLGALVSAYMHARRANCDLEFPIQGSRSRICSAPASWPQCSRGVTSGSG